MNDYLIVTDSTNDLPQEIIEKKQIQVAPLTFSFGADTYQDLPGAPELSLPNFYQRLRSGEMPTTAQVNQGTFLELFSSIFDQGKDILYLAFSSGLSGTYSAAQVAAEALAPSYPEGKIAIVDSKSGSLGQGLLVLKAATLKQKGTDLEQARAQLQADSTKVQHWFTVDDLNFLRRGGRISRTLAAAGTILHIKPILNLDQEGGIVPFAKIRGRKRALTTLAQEVAKAYTDPNEPIYISHADCEQEGQELAALLEEKVKPKAIHLHIAGPIISCHVGPGALGVYFLGQERAI